MSIQSNINQGLAIGAALLSQTPRADEVKEKRAAMRDVKTKTEQKEKLLEPMADAAWERANIKQEYASAKKDKDKDRMAELEYQYGQSQKTQIGAQEAAMGLEQDILKSNIKLGQADYNDFRNIESQRMTLATLKAESLIDLKKEQKARRRTFMSSKYLGGEEYEGVHISDLGKNEQKQIAAQFSPSERKKYIDAKDAQRKGGK